MIFKDLLQKFNFRSSCNLPRVLVCLHILKHLVYEWIKHDMLWDGLMSSKNVDEIFESHVSCSLVNLVVSALVFVVIQQSHYQSFVNSCCFLVFLVCKPIEQAESICECINSKYFVTLTCALLQHKLERVLYCHFIETFKLPACLTNKCWVQIPYLKKKVCAFKFQCIVVFIFSCFL